MGILLLYCKQFTLAPQNVVIFHRPSPTFATFLVAAQAQFPSVCGKKDAVGNGILSSERGFPRMCHYSFFSPNTPVKKLPTAEKNPFTSSNTLLVTSPT